MSPNGTGLKFSGAQSVAAPILEPRTAPTGITQSDTAMTNMALAVISSGLAAMMKNTSFRKLLRHKPLLRKDTRMNDRIRLAEAMGWKLITNDVSSWVSPSGRNSGYAVLEKAFDPLTDANDDYAVLEWMLDKYRSYEIEKAFDHNGFAHRWVYSTGYYAESALTLLNGDMKECEECQDTDRVDDMLKTPLTDAYFDREGQQDD